MGVGHGKGKNLSSLGDLLVNIAAVSSVKPTKKEGLYPAGETTMKSVFSGDDFSVDGSVSKVNFLVMEFVKECHGVRERWPMGLGKYLLTKLEASMKTKGVLQLTRSTSQAIGCSSMVTLLAFPTNSMTLRALLSA